MDQRCVSVWHSERVHKCNNSTPVLLVAARCCGSGRCLRRLCGAVHVQAIIVQAMDSAACMRDRLRACGRAIVEQLARRWWASWVMKRRRRPAIGLWWFSAVSARVLFARLPMVCECVHGIFGPQGKQAAVVPVLPGHPGLAMVSEM